MKFITAYGEKRKVSFETKGPSMAHQSFKKECDINNILAQYARTGLVTHARTYEGEYGEFAEIDFHEAMNTVAAAVEMFETVPSEIRKRFNNDPGEFLDFVTKEENKDAMYDMGLAKRRDDSAPKPEPKASKAEPEGEPAQLPT